MYKIELMLGEGTTVMFINSQEEIDDDYEYTWLENMEDFEEYWEKTNKIELDFNTNDNDLTMMNKVYQMIVKAYTKEEDYKDKWDIRLIDPEWYIKHIWYNNKDIEKDIRDDFDTLNNVIDNLKLSSSFSLYEIQNNNLFWSNLKSVLRDYRLKELGL